MASPKTQQTGSTSMVRKLTTTAVMAAIATILMYIEFPIPVMPAFVKLDFSELPALLTSFALGPWYGALVCLLKNLIHLPVTSSSGVGELANFLIGIFFVIPAGAIYQKLKSRKGALIGSLLGALIMAAASFPINYFIVYPFYTNFMPMEGIIGAYQAIRPGVNGLLECLITFNMPFTFIKGLIDAILCFLIYKPLSPILHGRKRS